MAGGSKQLNWPATRVTQIIRVLETSTTPLIADSDAGTVFVKVRGNPEGPSSLICEYVGTRLAELLGLPTLMWTVIDFPDVLCCPLPKGAHAESGPAFVTREVSARPWGGTAEDLAALENPEVLAGLVVHDTWLRNRDRYSVRGGEVRRNERNVLLSEEGAKARRWRVVAMDFSDAFRSGTDLKASHFSIDAERDASVFGLFPEFAAVLDRAALRTYTARLRTVQRGRVAQILLAVPAAWGLSAALREKMLDFIVSRAAFVGAEIENWLREPCGWQSELSFTNNPGARS